MSDRDGGAAAAARECDDWIHAVGLRQLAPVPAGPDGRCVDGCLSAERALERANPGYAGDSYGDAVRCYSCEGWVCLVCATAPVLMSGRICDRCGDAAAAAYEGMPESCP